MRMINGVVAGCLMAFAVAGEEGVAGTGGWGPGSRVSFNAGWLFDRYGPLPQGSVRKEPSGLENPLMGDASWRKLDLPHDWGIEGPFRMDLPGTTGKLPWVGTGWYRKHFTVPAAERGKRFFIDFDGAMSHARVWLNGVFIGAWPYGYSSFRLELTGQLRFGGENVIAVRLENPPESSRWYPGAGIYRNVWLATHAPVHVGHWGTFITTPTVSVDMARVLVSTEVVNQSTEAAEADIEVEVRESGREDVMGSASAATVHIPGGGSARSEISISIPSPRLWDLQAPNLYVATTTIRQKGRALDVARTTFGVRTAEFTPDRGFLLNGRRVPINGVCNHHDLGPLGTAVNVSAWERQIRLLQEMGCNAIRTSHNPPAPELLDVCDRTGMLILDEAFDCWERGKTPNDYSTLFPEWHEKDLRALVRRDRNHPCVIAWSIGNEVAEQNDGVLSSKLRSIVRAEDSTRAVTAGCDNSLAGFNGFQNSVDIFGYNYKPHLYGPFRAANPLKPLFGSETASCISTNGEYVFPVCGDKAAGLGRYQVSSYDLSAPPWATNPDIEFAGQDRTPSVAGEFVWTGFDYLGEPTPFGDSASPARSSYFGILDLCGFKKDRFYLYQSRWRPEVPMVHILPHWNWPDRMGQVTPVQVYTSGDEVELFINGASLGRKRKEPFQYRLRWDDVQYVPGELRAVAFKGGKEWATGTMKTTGAAVRIELSADREGVRRDSHDLVYVTARIVDSDGLTVPTASHPIRFQVAGPGSIAAVGNGDPTSHASFQSDRTSAFHGQCLMILRGVEGRAGAIRVAAESASLDGGTLTLTSR